MRRLLRELVMGEWLRHRPVGLASAEQKPVRAMAVAAGGEREVTSLLFPVSLYPLVIGLARRTDAPSSDLSELRMRDEAGELLGAIRLRPTGAVEYPGGRVDLFRPCGSSVRCVSAPYRGWRYVTAWRHMRLNARRPGAFHMDFADIKALNVFYMMPRPVYLVSVVHGEQSNLFPMDLVGPLGADGFALALRTSSRSIETILASGRIVLSGAPARLKGLAYRLGGQHRERSIDWRSLEVEMEPSPRFGFPVPSAALGVRELELRHSEVIGSHRFFVASIADEVTRSDEPQLCHVSDMYARRRVAQGRPFADA
jgi:flavin reductase (DIM6/NTAB) family NADH-FMN oxidoreductase RutF